MTRTAYLTAPLLLVAVLGALVGCAGSLQATDPDGYAACKTFSDSRASTTVDSTLNLMLLAGEQAYDATTPAIKAASEPMFTERQAKDMTDSTGRTAKPLYVVDADALHRACTDAGYVVADIESAKH